MKKSLLTLLFIAISGIVAACPVDLDPTYNACDGNTILLDSNGDPTYNYQWYLDGTLIPGATNPTYTAIESGLYQVDATNGTTNCSDTTIVTFIPLPTVGTGPFEIMLCDDEIADSITDFDLTVLNDEITLGDINLTVTWYQSVSDEANDIEIASPFAYTNLSNPQTVVARVTNGFGCKELVFVTLTVLPNPTPNTPTPLIACDISGDGFSEFDLTNKDIEIVNGEPDVNIMYFETQINAELGDPSNALPSPYTNVVPFTQIVYARVTREVPPNPLACFTVIELELQVANLPDEPTSDFINPIAVIDDDGDGLADFDLTINDAAVFGTQNPGDFDIAYYTTEIDAQTSQNPIATPNSFTSNGQTVWVKLESLITACYRITPFELVVEGLVVDTPPDDIFNNEGDGDGLSIFDLTVNEAQMLGSLNPSEHAFSYHLSLSDANNELNPIDNPTAFQNTTNPQEIHVRMFNTNSGSYALASFVIETDGVLGISSQETALFVVFPNPVTDVVNVVSEQPISEINIFDMNGRQIVSHRNISGTTGTFTIETLTSGVYWLQFISETHTSVQQIIKE